MSTGAMASSVDGPMRTAGGRYAYVVPITSSGGQGKIATPSIPTPAPQPFSPPSSPAALAASSSAAPLISAAMQEVGQGPVVLTPVQGPLLLDGRYLGDLSGAVDRRGDGEVDTARLLDLARPVLGEPAREALVARIGGRVRAPMSELSGEDFSVVFDVFALSFVLMLGPNIRARNDLSLAQREIIDPGTFDQPANFSAGATVSLGQQYSHDRDEFSPMQAGVDLVANVGGFGGVTLTTGFNYDGSSSDDKWERREIQLSKDIFRSAIRLSAGELMPPIDGFQSGARILGVSAARAYSEIRPFQNIRPSGRQQFVLDRSSLVEVEVNGVIVDRLRLEPGPYSLADFPYGQGANTVRLLVDDDGGRREIAVFDLFGGAGLLDRGVLDFGGSMGVLEEGERLQYGSTMAATGFARYGLRDTLTVGANAQMAGDHAQVGAVAVHGARLGMFQLSGAASRNGDTGRAGTSAAVDYLKQFSAFERDDIRLVASFETASRYFQSAFDDGALNRERWRAAAQVYTRLREYSLALGVAVSKGRDGSPDQRSYNASLSRAFGRFGVNLSVSRTESLPGRGDTRVGLSLTTRVGDRWSSQARYDSQSELAEIGLSRASSGELNDLSGYLRVSRDPHRQSIAGQVDYINNRFDAQLVSNRLVTDGPNGGTSHESLWRATTTIGYADGALAMGRASREGFIIASRHSSLAKSELSLNDGGGQPIAHSGLFGPPLAQINRAYNVHRLMLGVEPLPPGYDLGSGLINAFPGYGSGYHFKIGSSASRTVMGVLIGPEGPMALISGFIESVDPAREAETPKQFFTNRSGRFVGDGLAPGRYRMMVGGQSVGEFAVPEEQEGLVNVGVVQATRL